MLANPSTKYRAFPGVDLPNREWPNNQITSPPVWMSTDLRDGNQALIDPMSVETKLRMFKALVEIGFKQIEIGFPSASQTDFDFTRLLIEGGHIPDDVTIEVLVQARYELIERTVESVRGAKQVILHLYNPLAPSFRRIVYQTDKAGVKDIALQGTRWVKELIAQAPEVDWVYQYSPEMFSSTELPFAKEVCDAVVDLWEPSIDNKIILNLPATVEMATPNTFADQIEWMHKNLQQREAIIISVHPHNDRGTAVAAAELALMAGADRVEGCLFGNGERTGNVDLVTLALNLYSQGIHPQLDFSRLDQIRQLVESCTQLPVHPRHPYAGELVFTAFSGSHQDAIKKGLACQDRNAMWEVPYLPVDPADFNRSYDAVVRVNSQSGKGGVSFLLQQAIGLELPRRLQIEFSALVQEVSDQTGKEISSEQIVQLFSEAYLAVNHPFVYSRSNIHEQDHQTTIALNLQHGGQAVEIEGCGNGPVDAAAKGLSQFCEHAIEVVDYNEHAVGAGSEAAAVCYLEVKIADHKAVFGVGQDCNITVAALKALINAINRSA
ncbi:2-isopropylmalate synthase [Thalassocella blandensis]|nr:2-isopropylmalate synthase [Thalassocella blandensis]